MPEKRKQDLQEKMKKKSKKKKKKIRNKKREATMVLILFHTWVQKS